MTTTEKIKELEKELAMAKEAVVVEKKAQVNSLQVGDTVYTIDIRDHKTIEKGKVVNIARWDLDNSIYLIRINHEDGSYSRYSGDDVEKYFFFEKEQAEEYLKQAKR